VIEMRVDDEALVRRITGRFTCGSCGEVYHKQTKKPAKPDACDVCGANNFEVRADDNEEALRTRLMAYYRDTSPLIGYYYARKQLQVVDGLAEIEAVAAGIKQALAAVE
jgi:adenylate kinase